MRLNSANAKAEHLVSWNGFGCPWKGFEALDPYNFTWVSRKNGIKKVDIFALDPYDFIRVSGIMLNM